MIPVDQDRFVDPTNGKNRGNCLQAVVASLLELPLDEVPNFVQIEEDGGREWSEHLRTWLLDRGWRQKYWLHGAFPGAWPGLPFEKFCAVSGPSPRGLGADGKPVHHIVISKGGVMVHDPHPDRTGITESHGGWWLEAVGAPCPAHGEHPQDDCMVCGVYLQRVSA
jgi:hypothetical protein